MTLEEQPDREFEAAAADDAPAQAAAQQAPDEGQSVSAEINSAADPYEVDQTVPSDQESVHSRPAALTINIQSWATPIVGLVMLIVGMAGGFFGRPFIAPDPTPSPQPAAAAQPPAAAQQSQQQSQQSQQPSQQQSDADRAALMEALLPNVRHFKGDPEAPITVIEFSDFQ